MLERTMPAVAYWLVFRYFFTPLRFPVPEKEKALIAEAKTGIFISGPYLLKSYEWGNGPVVIFMHGWSSRATHFHNFIRSFTAAGYRCVAFDGPAHGLSPGTKTDLVEFGEALLAFGKMFGQVHALIAHSMGGAAAVWAIKHGLATGRLIIMSTPTRAEDIIRSSCERLNASEKAGKALKSAIRNKYGADLEEYTAAWLAKETVLPPVLLIYDKDDPDAPPVHGEMMQNAIPGAELNITEKLGHTRILRDHDVIEKAARFLSS